MKTAYSYLRFSSPKQVDPVKLKNQIALAKKYAEENDLYLNEELSFQDLGVSAFTGDNRYRGELADFLLAVRNGIVEKDSYLLVESLDRLSRDTARKALRTLEDICDEGITVVTLLDRQEYTTKCLDEDPIALLISLVIFLRANDESMIKRKRVRAAWERKWASVRKGEKHILSKIVPTWLKVENGEMVIVEEWAEIVRD